jgi:hypothetical protein
VVQCFKTAAARLPNVALVQVAIRDRDVEGSEVHVLEDEQEILREAPFHEREELDSHISYDRLAHTLKFKGCEVLMVNTEGHDVSTVRSMMAHCSGTPDRV